MRKFTGIATGIKGVDVLQGLLESISRLEDAHEAYDVVVDSEELSFEHERLSDLVEELEAELEAADPNEVVDHIEAELDDRRDELGALDEGLVEEHDERWAALESARVEFLETAIAVVSQARASGGAAAEELCRRWGNIIGSWREAEGLSLRTAAEQLGTTSATLSRYENGQRTPTLDTISEHVVRLRVTPDTHQRMYVVRDGQFIRLEEEDVSPAALERRREQLSALAEALDLDRLDVLVRLAAHPEALDEIRAAAPDPLRERILAAGRPGWEVGR